MDIYIPVVGTAAKYVKINIDSHAEDYIFELIADGLAYATKEGATARTEAMRLFEVVE